MGCCGEERKGGVIGVTFQQKTLPENVPIGRRLPHLLKAGKRLVPLLREIYRALTAQAFRWMSI